MAEFNTVIDSLFNEIIVFLAVGAIAGFGTWLRSIHKNQAQTCNDIAKIKEEANSFKLAFALYIKMITKQAAKNHPEDEEDFKDILKYVNLVLKDANLPTISTPPV